MISLREVRKQSDVGNLVLGLLILAPLSVWAADLSVPNTFTAGTPAVAAEVNANFNATATAVNSKQDRVGGTCPAGQAIRSVNADGSVVCQNVGFFGGDGSAGDLTVAAGVNWNTTPPANPYFANITINSGQTLTVPAGTTIRCSGSFTNNGTLSVLFGAQSEGAFTLANIASGEDQVTAVAHPGDTPGSASLGQSTSSGAAVTLTGGAPGKAIPRAVATTSFGNFRIGGGSAAGYDNQGGQGGGLVKIYCNGSIINTGTINAAGVSATNGSIGGGGGGIVVLASRTLVNNTGGTINVNGGNGGSTIGTWGGNGGGGGGGIVIMISPQTPVLGTVNVAGGNGATGTPTVNALSRTAGAGGGGSGGAGGAGGSVSSTGTASAGVNGSVGYSITLTNDPLFMAR